MKTSAKIIAACLWLILIVGASSTVWAKIYVWEDADGRIHYASDPEEVPQTVLDDDKQLRVIESTIVPEAGSPAAPGGDPVRTAVTPPSVPTSEPAAKAEAGNELQTLQQEYRNLLQNMRDFRKNNKDLNHPEYKQMQQKVLELRRKMAEARQQATQK